MSNNATNTQTLDAYNHGVDRYAASLNADISGSLKKWFEQLLGGLPASARILELGSGTGRDADYIEALGYRVERTDGSGGFVTYQTSQGKDIKLLNVLRDNIETDYDLILANAVFLHFTEAEFRGALSKVSPAVRVGGRIGLSLKRGDGEETTDSKMNAPRYFHYWQPEAVQALLEEAGFKAITISIADDWRKDKPQWLFITAVKGERT